MINLAVKSNRPSLFWLMTEPGRALTELSLSYPYKKLYKKETTGDGHPVMILPGFLSTKQSTAVMREFIEDLGYSVFDWGLGRNLGKIEYTEMLLDTLEELYAKKGQKISLIGWSLGGIFARQLAKEKPDMVRQVITLGSPFRDVTQPNNIEWVYSLISRGKKASDIHPELLESFSRPIPVPTTSIYSKEDGIVQWKMCIEKEEDDIRQNIQVRGSHIGLGVNASVLAIIADRLQYKRENWQHFQPKSLMDNLLFYPSL